MGRATEAQVIRNRIRLGEFDGQTSGLAPGHVQSNLIVLPVDWAGEFLRFCQANPKSCPLLAVSEPGSPLLPTLGQDIDIRTDLPRYRVYRDGDLVEQPTDILSLWRDDLVAFLIGATFSCEESLLAAGISMKHITLGRNVPMYRTNIQCVPVGRFSGPMLVSMRPLRAADAIRAIQITTRFPSAHGAPVHLGRPDLIGIDSIPRPDYGQPTPVEADEMPVFWACGVTPQATLPAARPPLAIGHEPGCMLVTDLLNSRQASF